MSSEYSIHLHDESIESRAYLLNEGETVMAVIAVGSAEFKLFVPARRRLDVSLLLHRLGVALGNSSYYIPIEDAGEAVESPHLWG